MNDIKKIFIFILVKSEPSSTDTVLIGSISLSLLFKSRKNLTSTKIKKDTEGKEIVKKTGEELCGKMTNQQLLYKKYYQTLLEIAEIFR